MIKRKTNHLLLLVVGMLFAHFTKAQQLNNASGGNVTSTNGSLAYSVGLVFYSDNIGDNGSVMEGVQHHYEVVTVGIDESEPNLSISAYPNPSKDNITIKLNGSENKSLIFSLIDINGKALKKGNITQETLLDMSGLPTASYFIHIITEENKTVKSFKIVKN